MFPSSILRSVNIWKLSLQQLSSLLYNGLVSVSNISFMMSETWSSTFYSTVPTTIFILKISLMAVTKYNIVYFSYQLYIAATFKITILAREYCVGGTSDMNKNIRLSKPNLLMMPLRLIIPLSMHMLIVWLTTIQLIIVQGNEGDTINVVVIMFDQILRYVTWHCAICFLGRNNTLGIWWLTSMYNLFHVFEGHNVICLIRFTFFIISYIGYSSLFPWNTWAFNLNMSKFFAIKTLDPFAPEWVVEILSFTIFFFMLNVLTFVGTLFSDILSSFLITLVKILFSLIFFPELHSTWSSQSS